MTFTISALHIIPILLVVLGIVGTVYSTTQRTYFYGLEYFLPGMAVTILIGGYYGLFWFFKVISPLV